MDVPSLVSKLNLEKMPDGWRKVSVLLSDTEYQNLMRVAARTDEGTVSAAIRRALKWKETPYGLKAKLVSMLHDEKEAVDGRG